MNVDQAAETVTFKGPKGRVSTVNVTDPALQAKLATLKPGQLVQFDYTEAVAADIRPAAHSAAWISHASARSLEPGRSISILHHQLKSLTRRSYF